MNLLKKIQSILLALAVFTVSLPLTVLLPSAEDSGDKTYVIWDAVPSVSKEKGGMDNIHLNRKSIWQDDSELQPNSMAVKSDEAGEYFEVTLGQNGGWGAVIRSGLTSNTKDYLGWLADKTFINNVLPYLTLEAELCRFGDSAKNPSFDIGLMPEWNEESRIPFLKANSSENFDVNNKRGEWIKVSHDMYGTGAFGDHLASGLFYVCAWADGTDAVTEDNPVTIGIRNLRLVVKDKDRLAFNKALKDAGYTDSVRQNGTGSWGWKYDVSFSNDANGNTDYFSAVAVYDEISEYSSNNPTNNINLADTENGRVVLSARRARYNTDVSFTVTPDEGYRLNTVKITDADGKRLAFSRNGGGSYIFKMPYTAPAVEVEFAPLGENDNKSYVIWDTDMTKVTDPKLQNGCGEDRIALKTDSDGNKYYAAELFGYDNYLHSQMLTNSHFTPGWYGIDGLINDIAPYLTLKFDIRRTDDGDDANMDFGLSKHWNIDKHIKLAEVTAAKNTAVNKERNKWHSIEGDIAADAIGGENNEIGFYVRSSKRANVDIRNIRIEVKEAYRSAVNEILNADGRNYASMGGYDVWQKYFEGVSGDKDYFTVLTGYDAESDFSPNNVVSDLRLADTVNGTAELSAARAKANKEITVRVIPNTGYRVDTVGVKTVGGATAPAYKSAVNGNEITYKFKMPNGETVVTVTFAKITDGDEKEYVVWDSVPAEDLSEGGMGGIYLNRKSLWDDNSELQPNSSVIKSDEKGFYYEISIGQNGGWGAVLRTGYTVDIVDHYIGGTYDQKLINKVLPYLTLKAEVRLPADGNNGKNSSFEIGRIPMWNPQSRIPFLKISDTENSGVYANPGEWHQLEYTYIGDKTFGDHLADNLFYVSACGEGDDAPAEDAPVTIGIRNLKLVVKEKDRAAFNQVLTDAGYNPEDGSGSWGWREDVVFEKDVNGNTDYFGTMIKYDAKSECSVNYPDRIITNGGAENGTLTLGRKIAKPNANVNFTVAPAEGYRISRIVVTNTDGTSFSVVGIKNNKGSFKMPDSDAAVTAVFVKKDSKLKILYQADPLGSNGSASVTGGAVTRSAVEESLNAWKIVYGDKPDSGYGNIRFTSGSVNSFADSIIPDGAEMTFKAKTSGGSKKLVIVSDNGTEKSLTLDSSLKSFVIPVKGLYGSIPSEIKMYVVNAAKGDEIYICGIDIWSEPTAGRTTDQLYEQLWDISDYEMKSENRQVAILGDPDGDVSPWASANGDVPSWSLAWFDEFKGEAPWYATFKENKTGEIYSLDFYNAWDYTKEQPDISEWVETGYMEFWVKSETDNLVIPMDVCNSDGTRAMLRVVYKKSKARSDGYMRVRIPLIYMASMGLDLAHIRWLHIRSIEPVKDDIYLTAFRFYSNLAPDKPDPVKPVEVEPEYNFSIDASMYSAKIDYAKKTITVSDGDQIWQLLSALRFEIFGTTAVIYKADGMRVTNDNEYFADGMSLEIVFDGYTYDEFKIMINGASKNNNTIDNSYNGNTVYIPDDSVADGDNTETKLVVTKKRRIKKKNTGAGTENGFPTVWIIVAAVAVVAAAGVTVFFILRKKRRFNKG